MTADPEDRMPPHHEDSERAVLGSMLLEWDACEWAAENLRAAWFYAPVHRHLFQAILDTWHKYEGEANLTTVSALLADRGQLEGLGGTTYLAALQESPPTAASIARYGAVVRAKARQREAMEACRQDMRELLEAGDTDTDSLIEGIRSRWESLAADTTVPDAKALRQVLDEFWKDVETRANALKAEVVQTGLLDFDREMGGLAKGSVYVLGGRPRDGKTTLTLNWLCHATIRLQQPALLFSLEMKASALGGKILAAEGDANAFALRQANLTTDQWHRLGVHRERIQGAPLYIDDTRALRLDELLRRARRRVRTHGIKLVAVDYLQIVQAPGRDRRLQVDAIMYALQALAGELDIPILLCCQRSRPEGRDEGKEPELSDLKESGGIEECADVVMFIWHPPRADKKLSRWGAGVKHLLIAKNRLGPMVGRLNMYWQPEFQRFRNATKMEREAAGVKAEEKANDGRDDEE